MHVACYFPKQVKFLFCPEMAGLWDMGIFRECRSSGSVQKGFLWSPRLKHEYRGHRPEQLMHFGGSSHQDVAWQMRGSPGPYSRHSYVRATWWALAVTSATVPAVSQLGEHGCRLVKSSVVPFSSDGDGGGICQRAGFDQENGFFIGILKRLVWFFVEEKEMLLL